MTAQPTSFKHDWFIETDKHGKKGIYDKPNPRPPPPTIPFNKYTCKKCEKDFYVPDESYQKPPVHGCPKP